MAKNKNDVICKYLLYKYYYHCLKEQLNENNDDEELIAYIDKVLSLMNPEYRDILEKEFLEYSEPYWYLEKYSRATFFRLKRLAIDEFVDCFNGDKKV